MNADKWGKQLGRSGSKPPAVEIAKEQIDPMAAGTLYAGIESACRDLRDRAASAQKQNVPVLTDAQKAKLNALNDAMKLNLLGSVGSPPYFFTTGSSFTGVAGFISGVSGCGSPFGGFARNVIPANRIDPVAP